MSGFALPRLLPLTRTRTLVLSVLLLVSSLLGSAAPPPAGETAPSPAETALPDTLHIPLFQIRESLSTLQLEVLNAFRTCAMHDDELGLELFDRMQQQRSHMAECLPHSLEAGLVAARFVWLLYHQDWFPKEGRRCCGDGRRGIFCNKWRIVFSEFLRLRD